MKRVMSVVEHINEIIELRAECKRLREELSVLTSKPHPMKAFYCKDFTGMYPVGTSAVVTAHDPDTARIMLNHMLRANGLKGDAKEMVEIDLSVQDVIVIQDGDY